jgi:hypothetical protein
MTTPDPLNKGVERPTMASSRFKITKEGIESEQSVPGEHTPGLLSSVVLMICAVMAVVAPAVTLKVAAAGVDPTWTVAIVGVQEAVILSVAVFAWVIRKH